MRLLITSICLLISLFASAPLVGQAAAPERQWATNLGRTVLARSDLIVTGTLSQTARRLGTLWQRDLVLDRVLWGVTATRTLTIVHETRSDLEDGNYDVLLALKAADATGVSYRLAARPELADSRPTIEAIAHYCEVEGSNLPLTDRLNDFSSLLLRQLRSGGAPARFAAVELIYFVLNHSQLLDHNDYLALREIRRSANRGIRSDIDLALRGLVAMSLKPDAQVEVMVSENDGQRVAAISRLNGYLTEYPEAFGQKDVDRCFLLVLDAPRRVEDMMMAHQRRLQSIIDARTAEFEARSVESDWMRRELGRRGQRAGDGQAGVQPFGLPQQADGAAE